jgi:dsRNA-specific ribonuclease
MKLYKDQFEGPANIGNRETFMDPVKMNEFAKKTEHLRYQIEDLQDNALKVFGDIFEALVAAVFLDSEGDLSVT